MKAGDYYRDTRPNKDGVRILVIVEPSDLGTVKARWYHSGALARFDASDFATARNRDATARFQPVKPSGTASVPVGALAKLQGNE